MSKQQTKSWNLQLKMLESKWKKAKAKKDDSKAAYNRYLKLSTDLNNLRAFVRTLTPLEREQSGDATAKPKAFGAKHTGR